MKQPLTLNEFQAAALRTCSPEGHQHFFSLPPISQGGMYAEEVAKVFNRNIGLLHALTKISEEAGEMWTPVNRAMWYGKEIGPEQIQNIKEEAGDLLWYIAGPLCRALGCTFEEIAAGNVAKLAKRYPDKFSEEAANARADKVGLTSPEGKVLRTGLSQDEKHAILEKYHGQTVDFSDGFYFDAEDKAWLPCPELWELL